MSLYLKYRPIDFENLVGQTFVKETLKKAITEDKTVGAYLFCGPRGTGKTSTARIFAKTINCTNQKDGNPCLKCDICKDFLEEKLIDIIEIDAASVTGVDNIRDIIEKSQFRPSKTKYKIYIIDEVHMLSKGAFNALLKILEEPPKHVKFILATTETHKVLDTIISRCQRYDFKRISDEDIKNRLLFIAKSENIETDTQSIEYIINNSSGGLRNAISLFEQLSTDGELNFDKIIENLQIVDKDQLINFLDKLLNKDSEVVDIFDKLVSDGKNIKLFFKELLFYTKNKSLDLLKSNSDISEYIKILEILDETFIKTKHSLDENITLLIGVLKIINGNTAIKENVVEKNIKNTSPVKKETIAIKEEKNIDEISHDDLNDVFGGKETNNLKNSEVNIDNTSSTNFDVNNFIKVLKDNGAKGGLTMAIRGTSISLNGENLIINVKTKIAKSQFENTDNRSLISKSLVDMGINDPKITIN